jgi:hypothetical protein
MNSAHDSKDWQMSQANLHHPIMAESPVTHHQPSQYSPMPSMDHHYSQTYSQSSMHPPV